MEIIDCKFKENGIKIILFFIISYIMLFSIFVEKKSYHDYKIVAISYADEKYLKQLKINELTAINIGKVDEYYKYNFDDIDLNFKKKNEDILSRERGNGYWLWKPYFILKAFKEKLNKGDYLIYTDAGIYYCKNLIKFLINSRTI